MRERLALVRERIENAGGDPGMMSVIAVTKGFGQDAVFAAIDAGLLDIGENYANELLDKAATWAGPGSGSGATGSAATGAPRWHFLGAIQRNKVGRLAPVVDCWQGVARLGEGEAIARRHPGVAVLVEVNTSGAPERTGCRPEGVPDLVERLRELPLSVRGLMTVAPLSPGAARPAFRLVRELADRLELPERSMGMSDDLEDAVSEGSTMVRIGRALFGERQSAGRRRGS